MKHFRNYAILSLIIVLLLLIGLKGWQKYLTLDQANKKLTGELSKVNHKLSRWVTLNDELMLKLQVAERKVTVKWRKYVVTDSTTDTILIIEEKYLPPEGDVKVVVDTAGEVTVKITNKGLCLRPYLAIGYSNQIFYGLGFRVMYWNRVGLYMSVICQQDKKIDGILGFNYTLDRFPFLTNSLLGVGYSPFNKMGYIEFGVRL